jgi:nucleoside-diphosphate-sugar epimerase
VLAGYVKVIVTGGLGFIGGHLVETLLALGKDVTVVDNACTATESALRPGAALVDADITSPEQVTKALVGADMVFHLAGNSSGTRSVLDPRFDFETNVVGTFNVLEASLRAGARRLLYVSSASVYGVPQRFPMAEDHPTQPFVPYGASKLGGELASLAMFHATGLPVVAARPFCVYGAGENPDVALVEVARYLRWHLNGRPIEVVGDPDRKTRDLVHVSDVVSALILIADRAPAGEVYNVGSGEETSMRELTSIIGDVTGRPAAVTELLEVTQDTYRLVADIAKLRGLGYSPRVSLFAGVRALASELGSAPELPRVATMFHTGQKAEHV